MVLIHPSLPPSLPPLIQSQRWRRSSRRVVERPSRGTHKQSQHKRSKGGVSKASGARSYPHQAASKSLSLRPIPLPIPPPIPPPCTASARAAFRRFPSLARLFPSLQRPHPPPPSTHTTSPNSKKLTSHPAAVPPSSATAPSVGISPCCGRAFLRVLVVVFFYLLPLSYCCRLTFFQGVAAAPAAGTRRASYDA